MLTTERNPFYPRMTLIGTNKTEALAVSLILLRKIKFKAKYSFVFIRVISGQTFPFLKTFIFLLLSFIFRFLFDKNAGTAILLSSAFCLPTPNSRRPCHLSTFFNGYSVRITIQ